MLKKVRSVTISKAVASPKEKLLLGKCWYFRTVTYHMLGRVVAILENFAELEGASWIGDSERFSNTILEGKLENQAEVEPVGKAFVNLDSVTDFFPWNHALPTKQR